MCAVIDYADPSSEKPSSGGGWGLVKRGDGWIAREKENGEETRGGRQIRKKKKKSY